MPGKMFRRRDDSVALRTLDKGGNKTSHCGGLLAIGTDIDNRIRSVVIYISNRRINLLHAQRARLMSGQCTLTPSVLGIVSRADRHVPGQIHRVVETHAGAGFQIRGDKQRVTRQLLHAVTQNHRFINWTAKQNDAAHVIVFNLVAQGFEGVAVLIQESGVDAD